MHRSLLIGARALRRRLLVAAALSAFPLAAFAGDVAPTPEGARSLAQVFATYLGKDAAAVTPIGDHYRVAIDFSKVLTPLMAQGATIDAAPAEVDLTEQSDGSWRVARDGYSPITVRLKDSDFSIAAGDYKFEGVFDPAIAGFRSADNKGGNIVFQLHAPKVAETINVATGHATSTGAAAPGGLSGSVHEELTGLSAVVTGAKVGDAPPPAPVTIKIAAGAADMNVTSLRSHEILDLWRYLVAHPSRADLAADEDGFKTRLRALLPLADGLEESVATQNVVVESPKGPFKADSAKISFSAGKFPSNGDVEMHLALNGLAPPPGAVPPVFAPLTPTAIDIAVKYNGYDYGAAAAEAINDMHLEGEGPVIAETDRPKITAKMTGGGPITITILPSHIVAAQLDVSVEGAIQMTGGHPSGKVTVKARDFDKTVAAIKGLGPLATPQVLAGLTMAKGLGKADADGSTIWIAEYGADGLVKLNGLPLGKAPTTP